MKTININRSYTLPERQIQKRQDEFNKKKTKTQLKNIIELTEEYQPQLPSQQNPTQITNQTVYQKISCWKKYLFCLNNLFKFFIGKNDQWQLKANDENFTEIINKIKKKKISSSFVLPAQKEPKKTLILDLDETLIHSTFNKPVKYDFQSQIFFNGRPVKIYTMKRFGLDSFLFQMSKLYQIVIFTASQKSYADKIIDVIDPKKRISHRLYRQNCIIINKTYYLKNLKILGRDLNQCVIVDDNPIAGILHPQNLYKIEPFEGNSKDRSLYRLMDFLKHISQNKNILPIKGERIKFDQIEISLNNVDKNKDSSPISASDSSNNQKNEGRSINERKKQYKHKKTNSQIETLNDKPQDSISTEAQTSASDMVNRRL